MVTKNLKTIFKSLVGSAELNIDGVTKDGKREPIFRNGNWAFELK
jgi:aminopeptidase